VEIGHVLFNITLDAAYPSQAIFEDRELLSVGGGVHSGHGGEIVCHTVGEEDLGK
jgi:hypothetical protein